jgi:hypothetical protein
VAIGVYPGSFDPLTIAHLAVADTAVEHLGLQRLDLAISRDALGKGHLDDDSVERRRAAALRVIVDRPWLGVVVLDARLVVDIADGYDAVVMGADKWAQVVDPHWYGDDPSLRDAAVARLPRIAVAPRRGHPIAPHPLPGGPSTGALLLPVPERYADVSASDVRAGRVEWAARATTDTDAT